MKTTATLIATLAGTAVLTTSNVAAAESSSADFQPEMTQNLAEFPWESGYIPSSGPLQLKIGVVAGQNVNLTLPGSGVYNWDDEQISFRGEEGAGLFGNELYAEVTATVAIDIFGFETEVEIGLWDISETAEANFTPYVLEGNVETPVTVAESIGPYNLVDTPITVGPADGWLIIDWELEVPGLSFQGTQIDLARQPDAGQATASVVREDEAVDMLMTDAEPGGRATTYGTQYGLLNSEVALHIYPTVILEVSGVEFEIGPFDLVVAYPLIEDEPLEFPELQMEFDVPEAPPSDDDGGEDDGGDDDDGADDGGDDDGDEPEDEDEDEEDEDEDVDPLDPGLGGGPEDGGCGCSSTNTTPSALFSGLLCLGLLGFRRRRSA